MRRLLASEHVGLAAISTGRVFAEQAVWLTHADSAVRRQAVDKLRALVELAAELGAPRVNIGRVRGPVGDGQSRESAERLFIDGISVCSAFAAQCGIDLVIEPVNCYETNYINSVDPDGITLVRGIALPNVKLMPDVFHMNIEDASIADSLKAAGPLVGYVHLADSNRLAPGLGHTDFPAIVQALTSIGYDGDVAVEILPRPSPGVAAATAITRLRELIPADGNWAAAVPDP